MNTTDIDGLIERLAALHVWPQFVADHYADILLPRQIEGLYKIGEVATEAAQALTTLTAEIARLYDCAKANNALAKHNAEGLKRERAQFAETINLMARFDEETHTELRKAEDEIARQAAVIERQSAALQKWLTYDNCDVADFSTAGPMLLYATAINETRALLAARPDQKGSDNG